MDKKEIAKLAVETVKDFLILINRKPFPPVSCQFLERMIVNRLEAKSDEVTNVQSR